MSGDTTQHEGVPTFLPPVFPAKGVFAYPPETSTLFRGDMQKPPSEFSEPVFF